MAWVPPSWVRPSWADMAEEEELTVAWDNYVLADEMELAMHQELLEVEYNDSDYLQEVGHEEDDDPPPG